MTALMLKPEFDMIVQGQKQKLQQIKNEPETIKKKELLDQTIKCLLRCEKLYEAREAIIRVLTTLNKHNVLSKLLEVELNHLCLDEAAAGYDTLLKLSFKLFNQVDRIRVDNPLLNRPFIVNKIDV